MAAETPRHKAGKRAPALRQLVVGVLLSCLASQAASSELGSSSFTIDAPQLAPALIQFSQQSGLSIVFSKRLTRNIEAPPVTGLLSNEAALNRLLANSGLGWEWVDDRVIAVYAIDCAADASCPSPEGTLKKYPLFAPGIEETFIYGTTVTGSRIKRTAYDTSAPVDVFSAPDIELSGAQTLGELLKFVPAVSGNAISTAISNGGDGTASVTLRGLPASNTLVLVNGRRVANNGLAGESVDLNSIPPAAVERIEILKDGASAIYGSDAIAGVVNVIMRRDFNGFLAETYYGEATEGDLNTQTHTLQYGSMIPRGSVFLSATLFDQDPIYSRDRDISSSADTRRLGGSDERSSATPDSRITPAGSDTVIATAGGYRPATDEDLFNYQTFTTAVVPLERNSLYGQIEYDLTSNITTSIEMSYLETEATAELAPTPVFSAFEQTPITVASDNIYNSFGQPITDVRRRLVELPDRRQRNESEVARFSAVMEGQAADWYWDLNYNWSRSEASQRTFNLVNADNLRRGVGPAAGCLGLAQDGCVPINLLGIAGTLMPGQVDFIRASGGVSGYSKLSGFGGHLSGRPFELRHGGMDTAFGAEFRSESTSKRPDALLAAASTIGGTNFQATSGNRDVMEFYAETNIPLWKNSSSTRALDVEIALRHSDYSDFGESTNPKIGVRLRLNKGLMLRGTYAEGFRAPSLNELYEGNSEAQAFINDPCTQPQNVGVLPGCDQQADPTRNQFLTIGGGNPNLKPETSDSWGAGVVWSPSRLSGLTLSLDLFQVEQNDVVSASAQFIVSQNARFGEFEDNIERDEMGNLLLVQASNINVGQRRVRGADLSLTYHLPKQPWGQLSLTGNGAYIDEYLAKLDPTAPELDLAGTFRDEASEGLGGIPQWKAQLGARWKHKRWRGNYNLHYVSSMEEIVPGTERFRSIDSWLIHDLQLSYTFNVLQGLRASLGVDNVFDEEAPLATSAFNDNIDGRTHELKGRYWYTKLSQQF